MKGKVGGGGRAVLDGSRSLVRVCTIAEEPVSEVVGHFYIVLSSTLSRLTVYVILNE